MNLCVALQGQEKQNKVAKDTSPTSSYHAHQRQQILYYSLWSRSGQKQKYVGSTGLSYCIRVEFFPSPAPGCSENDNKWYYISPLLYLPTKVHVVKAMVFPVVMYGCESWTVKKAEHRRIDAFELWCWRTLLSPLDCKEIPPVHPRGDHSWVFIGRTNAEAETPILCPPHAKSWLVGKDPDAGRDWGQEKGTIEDEMVGWHHWLDRHEFE